MRAAQPQMELTTTSVVPFSGSAESTASGVRSSVKPIVVSSARMGWRSSSGYMLRDMGSCIRTSQAVDVEVVVADQREDGGLRHHEKALVLERDLDRGLAEKECVVAHLGLHRDEARL